jgi:hypothetical protein
MNNNIFEEFDINPFDEENKIVCKIIERIKDNPKEFKKVSNRAIELGVVEKLSEKGYIQAIQNVAYKIFVLSLTMNLINIPIETDSREYYNYDKIGDEIKQLDEIINIISFASGRHWDYVSNDIDLWIYYYNEKFYQNIKNLL